MRRPVLILFLLVSCCLTLTGFVLRDDALRSREGSKTALAVLFGDGRRLFANHFLSKADAYFHRGRYPSVFEMAQRERGNALVEGVESAPHVHGPECDHDDEAHVHGADGDQGDDPAETCQHGEPARKPDDWIARLSGRLQPDQHLHLEGGKEDEILPWVKLAVEMDPHNVDAYTVGGYWLGKLGKPQEAMAFLREGQRNNPDSCEIHFELGRVAESGFNDTRLAARLYELAIEKWSQANEGVNEPDTLELAQMLGRLGQVREGRGELGAALRAYTVLKTISHNPEGVQRRIDAVREKMGQPGAAAVPQ